MASAKLIKSLEKMGFFLEFPEYNSLEEEIIEIIKEGNDRILLALPILLMNDFDYGKVCLKLNKNEKQEFNKVILISLKIYKKEKIENKLERLIRENKIKGKVGLKDFERFYESFNETRLNIGKIEQESVRKQSNLRLNLNLNKDLQTLFSPAKIRIMNKIFNHEKLTNTELKYYYRAISNINKAVLNPELQNYLRIIEISKKIS